MKLRQVPVDQVLIPEVRVTAQYDEEHLALLRDSLAAMGTVQPIIVVQDGQGYQVVDGLHRLQEARARGERTIPAVVYEGSPQDTLLMNLVLNRVRGKTKASEMVAVIGSLWKEHGMDSEAIGEKTGLGRDYVEKLQRISQAAPGVQEALDKEVIGVGLAHELSRLPARIQQEEILARLQVWRYTVKELKELVDNVLREMESLKGETVSATPGEPPAPPKYYCEGCKAEVQPRYLKAVQVCPDCFGEVWRLARARELGRGSTEDGAPPL